MIRPKPLFYVLILQYKNGVMSKVLNVVKCKCPNCNEGKVFSGQGNVFLFKMPTMNERCSECNFKFEKETGFFFGAMFVSYALAVAQMIISLVLFWYFVDLSPLRVFTIIALVTILLSTFNFRLSRSIWIHLFYKL
ncbi:Uncharacterized conserved protein, DUF983 family [Maribacter dokdonensis]|uniref:Uncharacterized conserved protein, DUF983 family n=2 Tax=Flavobacteriaceae TaxID=49546 RepID=A0A1H4K0V8_9FLAO|nr:Uncharacterized conserved protein, DUF983 family [Maribacter dokdonensis]